MTRFRIVLIGALLILAVGTSLLFWNGNRGRTGTAPLQQTTVTLRQEWFPNSNYAGALFASHEFATRNGIRLVVQPGADNIDPIKLVLSGESMFGDAGADRIIAANEKGADFVVIGALNNVTPTVFVAKRELNIKTPLDFVGKRVGVLTGTSTEYVYRILLSKLHIDKSSLTEIEAPFDLATFVQGAYDVRPAFVYDEPVSLDIKHVPYTIVRPADFGVRFMGTVYFTRRKFAQENPELVQKFINSVAQGWNAALKDPERAIHYLKAFDRTIEEGRELQSLIKSRSYFAGYRGQPLHIDPDAWTATMQNLQTLGVTKGLPSASAVDMRFVDKFYQNPL